MFFRLAGGQPFRIAAIVKLRHTAHFFLLAHPPENRRKGTTWQTEASAKNPPRGNFLRGVFYVAAALRGLRVKSRDLQG